MLMTARYHSDIVAKYKAEYERLRQIEWQNIERARMDRTPLSDHYWMPRHKAEQLYKTALILQEVLNDEA